MKRIMTAAATIAMLAMFCVPIGAARMIGDVDESGAIDIVDALMVAMHDAKLITLPDLEVADVDGQLGVNIVDALQIARFDAKLITKFSAELPTDNNDVPPENDPEPIENIPDEPDGHYNLTITESPEAGGTTTGQGYYQIASPANLADIHATPTPGWKFTGWSGDYDGRSPAGFVVMDANKNVTANFEDAGESNPDDPETDWWFDLTVSAFPSSQGTVEVGIEPQPEGYISGTRVRVTGVPATGYMFSHWFGDVEDSQAASTRVVMDEDQTVTARFVVAPITAHTLTTTIWLDGLEVGIGDPLPGAVYPASGEFADGELVTFIAVPFEGYMFDYWEIYAPPAGPWIMPEYSNPIEITMSDDVIAKAHFTKIPAPPITDYVQTFGWIASLIGGIGLVGAVFTGRF